MIADLVQAVWLAAAPAAKWARTLRLSVSARFVVAVASPTALVCAPAPTFASRYRCATEPFLITLGAREVQH